MAIQDILAYTQEPHLCPKWTIGFLASERDSKLLGYHRIPVYLGQLCLPLGAEVLRLHSEAAAEVPKPVGSSPGPGNR